MGSLIEVKNLKKYYSTRTSLMQLKKEKLVKAVDGISFSIRKNENIGIAGETGCGKTTVGKLILKLLNPTEGNIYYKGNDIQKFKRNELKNFRKKTQMVFQDPFGSMNPRKTVYETLKMPFKTNTNFTDNEIKNKIDILLEKVNLPNLYINKYPHELSGGEKQRIGIARSIALNPEFIVADEPVASLDVSLRLKILDLMMNLKGEYNLTFLFITHDLAMLRYISKKIIIMYLGKIIEIGQTIDILEKPHHPYSKALLSAVPRPDPNMREREKIVLIGDPPSPIDPPLGCRFHTRCPYVMEKCKKDEPPFVTLNSNHKCACWLY